MSWLLPWSFIYSVLYPIQAATRSARRPLLDLDASPSAERVVSAGEATQMNTNVHRRGGAATLCPAVADPEEGGPMGVMEIDAMECQGHLNALLDAQIWRSLRVLDGTELPWP
jgi:hypothetical protein